MKHPFLRIATLLSLWVAAPLWAADAAKPACATATDADVAALFDKWNLASATLDSAKVADLYLARRRTAADRVESAAYQHRADQRLSRSLPSKNTRAVASTNDTCTTAAICRSSMGLYTLFLLDKNGKPQEAGRALYLRLHLPQRHLEILQHHHSSAMPEPMSATPSRGACACNAAAGLAATREHRTGARAGACALPPVAAADSAPGETPAVAEATPEEPAKPVLRARLQRTPPMRHISEFVSKESLARDSGRTR
jgi:hypothetical protein